MGALHADCGKPSHPSSISSIHPSIIIHPSSSHPSIHPSNHSTIHSSQPSLHPSLHPSIASHPSIQPIHPFIHPYITPYIALHHTLPYTTTPSHFTIHRITSYITSYPTIHHHTITPPHHTPMHYIILYHTPPHHHTITPSHHHTSHSTPLGLSDFPGLFWQLSCHFRVNLWFDLVHFASNFQRGEVVMEACYIINLASVPSRVDSIMSLLGKRACRVNCDCEDEDELALYLLIVASAVWSAHLP